jgi:hypothetical protein
MYLLMDQLPDRAPFDCVVVKTWFIKGARDLIDAQTRATGTPDEVTVTAPTELYLKLKEQRERKIGDK